MSNTHKTYPLQGELFSHQNDALAWMKEVEDNNRYEMVGGILSLTQGLGKTLTSITHIVRKYMSTPPEERKPSLVLVKKALLPEWEECIRQFYPDLLQDTLFMHSDYLPQDTLNNITQEMINQKTLVITTYETLMYRKSRFTVKSYKEDIDCCLAEGSGRFVGKVVKVSARTLRQTFKNGIVGRRVLYYTAWRYVIADESQKFANNTSWTFRAVMGVYGQNKWCLTGTPIRNKSLDLFTQLRWCGLPDRMASNSSEWKRFVKQRRYQDYNMNYFVMSMNYETAGIVIPEKVRHIIPIDLTSEKEKEMYKIVLDKTRYVLSESLNNRLGFSHVLAMFTRLRQTCVASHAITPQSKRDNSIKTNEFFEPDTPMSAWCLNKDGTAGTQSTKNLEVLSIVRGVPEDEKILIFSNFVAVMDLTEAAILLETDIPCFMLEGSLSSEERNEQLASFKATPGKAVLIINYKVGSEGLNITEANHVICLEPWWNFSTHAQAEARCWRIGQTRTVHVYDIFIRQSIESRIIDICSQKRDITESFLGRSDSLVADETRLTRQAIQDILGDPLSMGDDEIALLPVGGAAGRRIRFGVTPVVNPQGPS